jgi:hypothetical protein
MVKGLTIVVLTALSLTAAGQAREAQPEQSATQETLVPKSIATTTIKRCPDGYEPVTRFNGQHGCARDFIPLNEPGDGFKWFSRNKLKRVKRSVVGKLESLYAGILLVVIVTAALAYATVRNPDFALPDRAKVARLLQRRPECAATVQDMLNKKLILSVEHDGPTAINVAVNTDAWSHLSSSARSAVALALYCATMPDDGLFIVAMRDERTTLLVWLMINGQDKTSRRQLSD